VDNADLFVTRYRADLETEGRRPARDRHAGAGREALAGDDAGWQSW